jgi:glycerol-3-phosphate dehydrogenase (NAD(P)+)
MRIAILGAGAWGSALAISLSGRHDVSVWTNESDHALEMQRTRANERYLPGFAFPPAVSITGDIETVTSGAELALIAVPSSALREVLQKLPQKRIPLVWACKGFEAQSAKLPHQVVEEELGDRASAAVLSGPSFAEEVAHGLPTAVTLASRDTTYANETAKQLHSTRLRIYSGSDVIGVEVAGAVKNVLAIAAGISDGMELGNNARAALMTRGLAEMTRLGLKLGGRMETFMGLAGMGDLFLTASSDLSRNRRVGLMLAKGQSLSSILSQLGHVAEGVASAREVQRLALSVDVEVPITQAICRVLHDGLAPGAALNELLNREPRTEH